MESRIQKFKTFHGIDRDINQQFKLVDNDLFVLYNNEWIQLTTKKWFVLCKDNLEKKYSPDFMRTVGLIPKYQLPYMDEIKAEMMYGILTKNHLTLNKHLMQLLIF